MNRGNLRVAISLHEHDSSISKKLNALMQTTNNNFQSEKFYSARNPWNRKNYLKDLSKTVREKARNLTQDLNPEKESSLSTFRFRPKFKEIIVGAVKPPYCFRGSPLMIGFDDETLKNPNISTPNFFPLSKRNSCHCRTLSEDFPKIILNKTSEIPKERISLKIPTINIHHKLKIEASANLRYDNNQMFLKRFLSKPTVKNNLKSSSLKAIQPPMIEFSDKTEELIIIDDKLEDKSTTFPSDNKNETVIVIPTQVIDIERKEQCIQTSFQDDWDTPGFDFSLKNSFAKIDLTPRVKPKTSYIFSRKTIRHQSRGR